MPVNTGAALADPTYQAFLQDVLAHPETVETVGPILADWLDEHDEPDLAAWHRKPLAGLSPPGTRAYAQDLKRIQALLAGSFCPDSLRALPIMPFDAPTLAAGLASGGRVPALADYEPAWTGTGYLVVVRCGFLTDLRITCESWLRYGRELVGRHPIRSIVPWGFRTDPVAGVVRLHGAPEPILEVLGGGHPLFADSRAAGRAMGAALLAWAHGRPLPQNARPGTDERTAWVTSVLRAGASRRENVAWHIGAGEALAAIGNVCIRPDEVFPKQMVVEITYRPGSAHLHQACARLFRSAAGTRAVEYHFPEEAEAPEPSQRVVLSGSGELDWRFPRLRRAYSLAWVFLGGAIRARDLEAVERLHDHEGELTVTWGGRFITEVRNGVRPIVDQAWRVFSWAWEFLNEDPLSVVHEIRAGASRVRFAPNTSGQFLPLSS
jgi:hypothetical protein